MKDIKISFALIGLSVLALGLFLVSFPSTPVQAQFPAPFGGTYSAFSNALPRNDATTASVSFTNSSVKRPIDVSDGQELVMCITYYAAGVGTSNVIGYFNSSLNGSQWTTDFPYSFTIACSGTTTNTKVVSVGTNIDARFLSLDKWENAQTNQVNISSITFSWMQR